MRWHEKTAVSDAVSKDTEEVGTRNTRKLECLYGATKNSSFAGCFVWFCVSSHAWCMCQLRTWLLRQINSYQTTTGIVKRTFEFSASMVP
jgi:hypothetical protein